MRQMRGRLIALGLVISFSAINAVAQDQPRTLVLGSPIERELAGAQVVVAGLIDQAAADAAGIKIGDVILAIDGESAQQRIAYLSKFNALSTAQAAYSYIYPVALRGVPDSKVKLLSR